ncbi:hypothetical protein CMEL01_05068 [Colletotrichum melonis]|uniref:Uncharacterized protein n=1 Tax=Colletotrichum melonis TaxID=1209925 RepID=A0AAI9U7X9_9PEZI|nr:hypothetical protein CMEL01_05068 [Colletotrichum melonis]
MLLNTLLKALGGIRTAVKCSKGCRAPKVTAMCVCAGGLPGRPSSCPSPGVYVCRHDMAIRAAACVICDRLFAGSGETVQSVGGVGSLRRSGEPHYATASRCLRRRPPLGPGMRRADGQAIPQWKGTKRIAMTGDRGFDPVGVSQFIVLQYTIWMRSCSLRILPSTSHLPFERRVGDNVKLESDPLLVWGSDDVWQAHLNRESDSHHLLHARMCGDGCLWGI